MKTKYLISGTIVLSVSVLIWSVLYGPLRPFKMKDVEIQRLSSPDGKIEAVYIQRDAGAMTTAQHLIYIVPTGQIPTKKDKEVFCGKRVFDLEYSWIKDGNMQIQYSKADICHFRNYYFPFPENIKYEVRIFEKQVGGQI